MEEKRNAWDEVFDLVREFEGKTFDRAYNVLNSFGNFIRLGGSVHRFQDGIWWENWKRVINISEDGVREKDSYLLRYELRKLKKWVEDGSPPSADFKW